MWQLGSDEDIALIVRTAVSYYWRVFKNISTNYVLRSRGHRQCCRVTCKTKGVVSVRVGGLSLSMSAQGTSEACCICVVGKVLS